MVSTRIGLSRGGGAWASRKRTSCGLLSPARTVSTASPPSVASSEAVTGTTEPTGLPTSTPSTAWLHSAVKSRSAASRGSTVKTLQYVAMSRS